MPLFALFLSAQYLSAQVLTTTDVLTGATSDTRTQQNEAMRSAIKRLNFQDPLLRQVVARVGINGSTLGDTIYGYLRNEDTYQLQVGFNSLLERKRQRQIKNARIDALIAEGQLIREQALTDRYQALTAYLYLSPRLEACRRLDTLLEKEHQVLREMLSTGVLEVNVAKVLNIEEDRNRNRQTIMQMENSLELQKNRIRQFAGEFTDIDRNKLAGVDDFRANFATLKPGVSAGAVPAYLLKSADIGLDEANLNYISAQNRQVFNNFSVGYQHPLYLERPKKFNTLNNFSLRAGLTVPLPANNRFKKADATLDLLDTRNEAAWLLEKTRREIENQSLRMENLFREYDLLQERITGSLVGKMLDNPDFRTQMTPLDRVELEIARQKMIVNKASLESDIAQEFVQWLQTAGVLGRNEEVDYLSKR